MLVPFFPPNAILVTKLENLSIYVQNGSRRRTIREEPDFNQVADYQSVNESYVVEDYGCAAFVENIQQSKKPAA